MWPSLQPVATCAHTPPTPPNPARSAHGGAVWSLAALPDGSGFVSGSADHDVKFWEWDAAAVPEGGGAPQLGVAHTR